MAEFISLTQLKEGICDVQTFDNKQIEEKKSDDKSQDSVKLDDVTQEESENIFPKTMETIEEATNFRKQLLNFPSRSGMSNAESELREGNLKSSEKNREILRSRLSKVHARFNECETTFKRVIKYTKSSIERARVFKKEAEAVLPRHMLSKLEANFTEFKKKYSKMESLIKIDDEIQYQEGDTSFEDVMSKCRSVESNVKELIALLNEIENLY